MRPEIKVYISAKVEHAPKLAAFRKDGFHINARWIHMAGAAQKRITPVTHWQQENFDDIAAAHFFILYAEPGDDLKGSLFEIGWAVGRDKQCWIAGDGQGVEMLFDGVPIRVPHRKVYPWGQYRQQIRTVLSLELAFSQIDAIVNHSYTLETSGDRTPKPSFFDRLTGRIAK